MTADKNGLAAVYSKPADDHQGREAGKSILSDRGYDGADTSEPSLARAQRIPAPELGAICGELIRT